MSLTQVTGPYPIFTDLDGSPLDDGYLYIGAQNDDPETNPIQVYWDSALTIPATQPIRTNSGYAWRNGTPGLLYTAGAFSITIRNKRNEFVLYSPVGYGFDPAAVSASVVKNDFVGDGVEVDFTLSAAPSTILATNVFINGVYQEKDSYSLLGNVITFSIAPPLNSSIEVMTNETGVINSGNATAISYTLTAPGAVSQTVQTKLEQYVSVKDFGAVGDGITDDTAAINAAISWVLANPESALWFEETTYLVGSSLTNGQSAFTLVGGTGFAMRGRPTFRITGTNAKGVNLFHVQMGNVNIEYVKAVGDTWTVPDITTAIGVGITAIYVQNPTVGTTISGFNFGEVVAENCSRTVLFDANTKTYGLSSDVYIDTINSTNTVYALNCAHSPNNLVCNQVVCDNVFRGYFPYGVDNHVVNVEFKSTYTGIFAAGTCANITVYTESSSGSSPTRVANTRNINAKVYNTSNRPTLQLSTVSQATTDNSTGMYNIIVDAISTTGDPLKIYNGIGTTPDTSTPFASPKRNIYIKATGPGACLSSTDYGVFDTANCFALTLDASNFLDSALAARQSMLTSGWNIIDARFGRQFFQQYWVAQSGSTSTLAVAANEDPHLGIGSDSSNQTRWRAGSGHQWFIGGSLIAAMNTGAYYPQVDNTVSLGLGSFRWSVVYAATGTINTSDGTQKQDIADLDAAEKRVAVRLKGLIKKFRFKDAVIEKGDDARIHIGVIAQDVGAAFEAENLDPTRYGIFCKDVLEDGSFRYGVRYEELLAFVIGAL